MIAKDVRTEKSLLFEIDVGSMRVRKFYLEIFFTHC